MSIAKWLNAKRLRDYPRLVLISTTCVLLLNFIFSRGWLGGLTGILMWGDYVVYYAGGLLFRNNIAELYDPTAQQMAQLNLIAPTIPPGVTLYSYPPNAAMVHAAFTVLPLPLSLFIWCLISIYCVILAAKLMHRFLVPDWLIKHGLSSFQLSILIFSSFSFTEGFVAGQMHSFTLVLMVAILISTMNNKWFLAGLLAGVLTFKPQFVIGFLLLWLIWGKYKAIFTFVISSSLWQVIVLITKGINPYLEYLQFIKNMTFLPYAKDGFPISILSTPYSFVATMIPFEFSSIWNRLFTVIAIIITAIFVILAYKMRKLPISNQNTILSMALLLPILISPYALLHDLLLLFPVMILLTVRHEQDKKRLLFMSVLIYISMLVLPLLGYSIKIALMGVIPIVVCIFIYQQCSGLLSRRISNENISNVV